MQFTVIKNTPLTPQSPDKSVFHLVLSATSNAPLITADDYQTGDWLALDSVNQSGLVDVILELLDLLGSEVTTLRRIGEVTARQALQEHLEITQLNPAILNKLQRQYQMGDWSDRQAMMDYAQDRDIIDLLTAFPALKEMGIDFLRLLSPLAPRYYSIASQVDNQGQVAVVYKQVIYEREGRVREGVASRYLSLLKPGDVIEGEFKANPTFKLPEDPATPIIMVGAGTGIAPFIGFMQQRSQTDQTNQNYLFFGETNRKTSFLFEEQLLNWQQKDQLQLFTAFSRDQAEKMYVQDLLRQKKVQLASLIKEGAIVYLCGSQTRVAEGVEVLFNEMASEGLLGEGVDWQSLKTNRQLQMDVY